MRNHLLHALLLALCLAAAAAAAAADPAAAPPPAPAPSGAAAHTAEQELAALRPLLIGRRYLEQARKRLNVQLFRMSREMDQPGPWMRDNDLVVTEFADDVQVMYVLDFPEGAQLVSRGMMQAWGMDETLLQRRALANLEARHGDLPIKPVVRLPWLYVIDAEDLYAASRVLLLWRWADLARELGGQLILGIPSRDVVVLTASTDAQRLQQLRDTVDTVERYQSHPITDKLFRWTPRGWEVFVPPER